MRNNILTLKRIA